MIVGLMLFGIGVSVARTDALSMVRPAVWIGPWLLGMTIIGAFGRYTSETNGVSSHTHIANWWDLLIVIAFNLVVFNFAVHSAISTEEVRAFVEVDEDQLAAEQAV
jgi:hypothetical protein